MPYTPFARMYPSLTPTPGLGSYGRTSAAILISQPRSTIGSQGRIYQFYKSKGQGQQYINFLLKVLGSQPHINNPWSIL